MKYHLIILSFLLLFMLSVQKSAAQISPFESYPTYKGNDLGVYYLPTSTSFKVWAPKATEVKLRLYTAGLGGEPTETLNMQKGEQGTWQISVKRDIKNAYYTFQILQDGNWLLERPDIYAKAVGVNGLRGMVVDLKATNPTNWDHDVKPEQKNFTDIILYELHMRDISVDPNSGILNKGKFLGLAEEGTKSKEGLATGLNHIKELGVTHVHLLPSFDFNTVDETKPLDNQYNWGYDPQNYNVPEGSYASNAYDGNVRIKEFKLMVQTLHKNGLRVILDVVYNHTSDTKESNFNQFAPGYFYRHSADGSYANGTGCGNEVASEREMVRKFILESVVYWVKEYHLDGFRFDLMGVHDIATMNLISNTLHDIDPTIFIYGEGWTAGSSPLAEADRATKINVTKLNQIAVFGDDLRDGLKGGWSNVKEKGFVSGVVENAESIKFGIVASTPHPQVDYTKVNYSKAPWAKQPYQTITYVSCHDDNTLFDRLKIANPTATEADLIKMDKLANAIVLTSQGVAFLHSGAEILRTKQGIANSFKSPDSINQIDWSRKLKYKEVFDYYKGLVSIRKNHPAFRMPTAEMIAKNLKFIDTGNPGLVAYQISNNANGDSWKNILVLLNGNQATKSIVLPLGSWTLVVGDSTINEQSTQKVEKMIEIPGTTAYVLYSN